MTDDHDPNERKSVELTAEQAAQNVVNLYVKIAESVNNLIERLTYDETVLSHLRLHQIELEKMVKELLEERAEEDKEEEPPTQGVG